MLFDAHVLPTGRSWIDGCSHCHPPFFSMLTLVRSMPWISSVRAMPRPGWLHTKVIKAWERWEDDLLKDWVERNGKKWTRFSRECLHHRNPSACASRWSDAINPTISREPFTAKEISLLKKGVEEFGTSRWLAIAEKYLPHRAPRRLATQWSTSTNPDLSKRQRWTAEEDQLLHQGVEAFGNQWTRISRQFLPWRSRTQILQRYRYSLSPDVTKLPWSQEEHDMLLRRTLLYGEDWAKVAEGLAGRTPKQCEEIWNTKVNPTLDHDPWSFTETHLFWRLIKVHEGSWIKVAENLPGRSRFSCSLKFRHVLNTELRVLFGEDFVARFPHENAKTWKVRLANVMIEWLEGKQTPVLAKNQSLHIVSTSEWTEQERKSLMEKLDMWPKELPIDWEAIAKEIPGRTVNQCKYHYERQKMARMPSANGRWTKEEDAKLLLLVKKYNHDWSTVSAEMGTRTPVQCKRHWGDILQYRLDNDGPPKVFTRMSEDEIRMIFEGVQMFGHAWKAVATTYLPHRTPQQCMRTYFRQTRKLEGLHRARGSGRWTEEEDKRLRFALKQYDADTNDKIPWVEISKLVEGRDARQCRERWLYRLKGGLRKGTWSYDEEMALLEAVQHVRLTATPHVSIWPKVAQQIGGQRTPQACANKFSLLQKSGSRFAVL